jgi:hypothetical protein
MLILSVYKLFPMLFLKILKFVIYLWSKFEVEFVTVIEHIRGSQNFGDFDQLVIVIYPFEKRLSLENHASKHASCTPNIKLIIIMSHADEELGPFEIS